MDCAPPPMAPTPWVHLRLLTVTVPTCATRLDTPRSSMEHIAALDQEDDLLRKVGRTIRDALEVASHAQHRLHTRDRR